TVELRIPALDVPIPRVGSVGHVAAAKDGTIVLDQQTVPGIRAFRTVLEGIRQLQAVGIELVDDPPLASARRSLHPGDDHVAVRLQRYAAGNEVSTLLRYP